MFIINFIFFFSFWRLFKKPQEIFEFLCIFITLFVRFIINIILLLNQFYCAKNLKEFSKKKKKTQVVKSKVFRLVKHLKVK